MQARDMQGFEHSNMPQLLRFAIITAGLAAGLVVLAPSGTGLGAAEAHACKGAGANPGKIKPAKAQRATVCLVNRRRARKNLPRVKFRKPLRTAAKNYSARMRNNRCFSHTCGSTLQQRVQRTSYLPCGCAYGLGETLAWGGGNRGKARKIVQSWMKSPSHRQILLTRSFRHIGVGVVWGSPSAPNKKRHSTYTAIFGYKN